MQVNTRQISDHPVTGLSSNTIRRQNQVQFVRPAEMSLFARVTCYPPLGQLTSIRRINKFLGLEADDMLCFTAVIESNSVFPEQPWEVHIWHNINSKEWVALPLKRCDPTLAPLLAGPAGDYDFRRYVFSEKISLPSSEAHAKFTLRFRTSSEAEWQWISEQHMVPDGELILPMRSSPFSLNVEQGMPTTSAKEELSKYLEGIPYDLDIEWCRSEAPGAILWSITGSVDGAKEVRSGLRRVPLGKPSSVLKYFSLVRAWVPWLGPRHGRDKFKLVEDAVLCSFLRSDGVHLVLLGISGTNDVTTVFKSGENGELVISSVNDGEEQSNFQVLIAAADDFEVAISAIVYQARKGATQHEDKMPQRKSLISNVDDVVVVEKDPKTQWIPEWCDGLTYCTWNSLGQDLSEEKILGALDTLKSHGIKVANLIIDDGWQTVDSSGESPFKCRWMKFEGNPKAFPLGLSHAVNAIRKNHTNLERIAVWHALFGYWGGISPDSDFSERFRIKKVKIRNPFTAGSMAQTFEEGALSVIDAEDIKDFYDEFYSYLASVGIDSVKADAHFFLDLLEDPEDRRNFTAAYQDAWAAASRKYFGGRSISCMSMVPQIMFHSYLPTNKLSIILRNSDDFFPEVEASHQWHVFCNAHNSLLTRYLNVIPDWDMFQTSHPYASFHAAARCVSGGPVCITDEPGKHDLSVVNQMTAETTQGKTVAIRPSVVGRTVDVYNDYGEGHILRIGCYTGWAKTGSGILGLFNIRATEASCIIPLLDFPGVQEDLTGQYIVRAHTSGKVTGVLRASSPESLVSVILCQKGWEILTAYPTRSFTLKDSRGCNADENNLTHVAVLGLLDKMTGAAALASSDIFTVENGRLRFDISLRALGVLGIYFSDLADHSIARNFMVMVSGRAVPRKTVWKEGGDDAKILAVDVLSAWTAMGLESGWSSEIFVQIYIG